MSLSNQLANFYQIGSAQSGAALTVPLYYGDRSQPIEKTLAEKKAEAERVLAFEQQKLADINAAIDAITDHPHVAKIINLLRKVGL